MKQVKFGNTSWNLDKIAFKTKADFLKKYSAPLYKFDKEEAWNELKKYIPDTK